ncbi:helix-turn-helix domain-containing protein [Methylobacterium sp. SI9]|uniref:helix-turn-helix domain-containing protein n=1 Tax=Methylobacterium guangdongense TaxID=3138811 RepID=UPI00313EA30E
MKKTNDQPFEASWEAAEIGGLAVSRTSFDAYRMETGPNTIRRGAKHDKLVALFRVAGTVGCRQYDRAVRERAGDLTILDNNVPVDLEFFARMRNLRVEVPREKLERMLGPARLFAALPIGADMPGASLARTFFDELVRVHGSLSPEMAERMMGVGVDLLVAAMAERMAQETPKPIQGTVTVQRAKAYIEANFGDHELDPPKLAAAVGVSLRRLQQLFHERNRHISDWIWERRLEIAAQRLADPGYAHMSIGAVSYGCGFSNQAHFSKRFRDRFGLAPSEHRRAALMPKI